MHRKCLFGVLMLLLSGVGFFLFVPLDVHAAACSVFTTNSQVPVGYASPHSFFASVPTLLISASCENEKVVMNFGDGTDTTYVYEQAYEWNDVSGKWVPHTMNGPSKNGQWYRGLGSLTKIPLASDRQVFFVGYTCHWTGDVWKCGCLDQICLQPMWQLQAYLHTTAGNSSSGSTSSGSGSGQNSSFVPNGYTMMFNDEFSGVLDLGNCSGTKWAAYWCTWNTRVLWDNAERAVKTHKEYTGNGNTELGVVLHEITSQGTLKLYGKIWLAANKAPFANEKYYSELPWIGGMISNEQSHSQKYGYWETRVKMNNISKGHHIAIWLLPTDGDWPPEIDMLEVANDGGSAVNKFFFNSHGGPGGDINWIDMSASAMKEWHVLGFLWTQDKMTWYLDGQKVREHANYINDRELYFLIAPEIGGNWPGKPNSSTQWPMEVEVDYVRVYKKQ